MPRLYIILDMICHHSGSMPPLLVPWLDIICHSRGSIPGQYLLCTTDPLPCKRVPISPDPRRLPLALVGTGPMLVVVVRMSLGSHLLQPFMLGMHHQRMLQHLVQGGTLSFNSIQFHLTCTRGHTSPAHAPTPRTRGHTLI